MIAVAITPPSAPKLVMVKVEPMSSSRVALPVRVASASRSMSRPSSTSDLVSASRITGTRSPFSVAVARPMWKLCHWMISPAASSSMAFICGYSAARRWSP